jgi:type VII secretion-associated serine protease mycosin
VVSLLAAACTIGVVGPGTGAAAAAKPACENLPSPTGVIEQEPWNQAWFDAPDKIWPFSTGAGTTVAVIDAGVDGNHPQLIGKVLPGFDFVRNVAQGDVDCLPHGTAEAGVISATRMSSVGFYGLAPDAKILPIRVAEREAVDDKSDPVDPRRLADGINYAVDHGADVIDCAVVSYRPAAVVAAAVKHALDKGVVVVAMVGDAHSDDRDGIGPTTPALTPYPADYPGVIGVGAIDSDGRRVPTSQIGTYVDLVAPGADVVASATVGQSTFDGTSIASAFVAATAALVLGAKPSLIGGASGAARTKAVAARLLATGGPELSGELSMAYGAGVVDPYRALTEDASDRGPVPLAAHVPPPPPPRDPAREAAARARRHTNTLAVRVAELVGIGVVVLIALAIVAPRGRARRWQTVRAREPRRDAMDDAPEFVAGEALFEAPKHQSHRE